MENDLLQAAFSQCRQGRISTAEKIAVGVANTSYLLTLDSGEKYVLRQLVMQHPDNARVEAKIQSLINGSGIVAPQYLAMKSGDVIGSAGGFDFTISKYINGVHPTVPTLALARSFGETLAKIHNALEGQTDLILSGQNQWLNLDSALTEIQKNPSELRLRLEKRLAKSRAILTSDLPKAFGHTDLHFENVFASGDKITAVFDFETAEYCVRVLDLARTYISFAYRDRLDAVALRSALFEGYDSAALHKLTSAELESFPQAVDYVAVVCAAWLQNSGGEEFVEPFLGLRVPYI